MKKDSVTELLDKLATSDKTESDKSSDSIFDDQQVVPACAMIGA
jgi:hypothetical protein